MIVKRGLESRPKVVEGYVTIVNRVLETESTPSNVDAYVAIVNSVVDG